MTFFTIGREAVSKRMLHQLPRSMKLSGILLISACLHVNATGLGRKVTIFGKDLPLGKVFSIIKKQTGYIFFYDYEIFQGVRNVTLDLNDVELGDGMRDCLRE